MNEGYGMSAVFVFAGAFLASLLGVGLFRRWSLSRGLIDVPNERSSHSTPVPRGGGLVIVVVCLASYLIFGLVLDLPISWGYLLGAVLVAVVSWLDDLYSLPFWSRLIVHFAAACILVYDVGYWSDLLVPIVLSTVSVGNTLGFAMTVVWLVWFLNAYNFMDGIDGIAGLQALVTGAAWVAVAWMFGLGSIFLLSGAIACSVAGFLIHNWAPARVFMGDVGSAFLGFTLAAMPFLSRKEGGGNIPVLPILALLFLWFFVFDTVFTFIRRVFAGKRVWEAHREHIYQKLVIEGRTHGAVALFYGASAAFLAMSVVLALEFSGIFPFLSLLSLTVLTFLLAYVGIRKKR